MSTGVVPADTGQREPVAVPSAPRTRVVPILEGTVVLAQHYLETPAGAFAGGACDFSADRAAARARAETVERASLIGNGPDLLVSAEEAERRGLARRLPDPDLAGVSSWIPATDSVSGESVVVPAEWALVRWSGKREPRWQQSSVGAAAHVTRDAACTTGLLEALERYAVRRTWAGVAALVPASDRLRKSLPEPLRAALAGQGLTVHAWLIVDLAAVPVGLVLVDGSGGRATFGSSAKSSIDAALEHAFCEAISVRAALAGDTLGRDERVRYARRAARHGDAFVAFLRGLEVAAPSQPNAVAPTDLAGWVQEQFGCAPLAIDIPAIGAGAVVKMVIPCHEFLVERHRFPYILAPGYLE